MSKILFGDAKPFYNRAIHQSKYIRWNDEATKIQLNWEEFNEISQWYQEHGKSVQENFKTVRSIWQKDHTYRFDDGANPTLYISRMDGEKRVYEIYYTYLDAEKAYRAKGAGSSGFQKINELVIEDCGRRLQDIFGRIVNNGGTTEFDQCVRATKYAIYLNPSLKGRKLSHMYKADISSAWPFALCGALPTLVGSQRINGVAEPTAEFPFAFYLKSGHIAEFNGFDTRELRQNKWYKRIEEESKANFKPNKNRPQWHTYVEVEPEDEITILCPRADYDLEQALRKLYATKEDKTDPIASSWAKAQLNSFIGWMRSNQYNKFDFMGHLSAIAYARATWRMVSMADKLVEEGNTPIYFAIDSIIWIGKKSSLTSKKEFGAFVSEAENATGVIVNHGQYCIEQNGSIILEKHQGIDAMIYEGCGIKTLDDYIANMNSPVQEVLGYDKKTHTFRRMRRLTL